MNYGHDKDTPVDEKTRSEIQPQTEVKMAWSPKGLPPEPLNKIIENASLALDADVKKTRETAQETIRLCQEELQRQKSAGPSL